MLPFCNLIGFHFLGSPGFSKRTVKITNPLDKKEASVIYQGKKIVRVDKSAPNPGAYGKLKKLNEYFKPKFLASTRRHQFLNSVKTNEPPKFLSSSGKRGGKFISVYNLSAQ